MNDLDGLRVLVVDANAAFRQRSAALLQGLGAAAVPVAADGAEALSLLRAGPPVDVVLSDWQQAGIDGAALLREMRADPRLAAIPLLVVTADVERRQVAEAIRCGVSDLLVRPYTAARLIERIHGALRRGVPAAADGKGVETPAAVLKPLVLVVDDEPDNRLLMAELFAEDYRVRLAASGAEALSICSADRPPDLVLLDVMMPGLSGFDVARRLREHPNSAHIPLIFVSGLKSDEARLAGYDLGAVDFVSKPADGELLLLKVRNFTRYVQFHKQRQQEYDAMLADARLRDELGRVLNEELRAPLSSLRGDAQVLGQDVVLDAVRRERAGQIERAALAALEAIEHSLVGLKR